MRFRKDRPATTTRVCQYGAWAPTEGADVVDDQIRLAHRYQNNLIENERARRDRYREIVSRDPIVAEAQRVEASALATYEAAAQDDADERATTRRRTTSQSTRDALKALKAASKAARKAEREAARGRLAGELREIDQQARDDAKRLRSECGVYWGTYLIVERSLHMSGPPPRFQRWDGTGYVAVQFQGGITEEALCGCQDNRARLELRDDWGANRRSSRRGTLWMRVASDGRAPVWAKFRVAWHRRIPEGARIKWLQMSRVRGRGGRGFDWSLCVTIETPGASATPMPVAEPIVRENAVAIDFGWRKREAGGVRVAYTYDSCGVSHEIVLPQWWLEGHVLVHDLRSIRDKAFNEVRGKLVDAVASGSVEIPALLADDAETLALWRATKRLAVFVQEWRTLGAATAPGVPLPPAWLVAWLHQDRHLYQWERGLEGRLIRWRRDWYRHWASYLAQRYSCVLVEDADFAKLKMQPIIGEAREGAIGAHVPASPGELRQQIVETCCRDRVEVRKAPAAYSTMRCAACGEVGLTRDRKALMLTCTACGVRVDQDDNAARVLHSYASGGTVRETPGSLAEPDAPWYRRLSEEPKRVVGRRERLNAVARVASA